MDFLADYGLFLAKTVTGVIAFLTVFVLCIASAGKNRLNGQPRIRFKSLNKTFFEQRKAFAAMVYDSKSLKQFFKAEKQRIKSAKKARFPKLFVITFDGDLRATQTEALTKQITAILAIAQPDDEVLVQLTSAGGVVAHYGLAASQLVRLRQKNIHLTVCIDSVAASGGYLMAVVANQIVAAPFAIIGSIGVVAQLPNFHRLLKRNHIDFEQVVGGEYKRTLTMFGENTDKSRIKVQEEVDAIHDQFKSFIKQFRPQLDLAQVATGEYWLAEQAKAYELVDRLNSSQDEICEKISTHDVYEVCYHTKKRLSQVICDSLTQATTRLYDQLTHSNSPY